MIPSLIILLCGLIRALVGAGRFVSRGWGFPLAGLLSAGWFARPYWWLYLDHWDDPLSWPMAAWWPLAFLIVPAAVLWVGIDGWQRRSYMARHLGAACIALAFADIYVRHTGWALVWGIACWYVGFFYQSMLDDLKPTLEKKNWSIFGIAIDANRCAEFLSGAVLQGGVVLIPIPH